MYAQRLFSCTKNKCVVSLSRSIFLTHDKEGLTQEKRNLDASNSVCGRMMKIEENHNKTKETLVPSAARDSRALGKDYRMLKVTSILIALKLAIEFLIAKTNG